MSQFSPLSYLTLMPQLVIQCLITPSLAYAYRCSIWMSRAYHSSASTSCRFGNGQILVVQSIVGDFLPALLFSMGDPGYMSIECFDVLPLWQWANTGRAMHRDELSACLPSLLFGLGDLRCIALECFDVLPLWQRATSGCSIHRHPVDTIPDCAKRTLLAWPVRTI